MAAHRIKKIGTQRGGSKGVAITNRCSCPLRGRLERSVQPGNSLLCRVDAAGQLNSMLSSI